MRRRELLAMVPFGTLFFREALAQTPRRGTASPPVATAPQSRPADPVAQALRTELAALSRAIPGRDFALVRWFGAVPDDVTDTWHLGVMNAGSKPVHAFLFDRGAFPPRGKYELRGEAREVSQRAYILELPSTELGTKIPNFLRQSAGSALVSYRRESRSVSLSDLATVAAQPHDPLDAEYWETARSAQPSASSARDLEEFRWKTPGLGRRILEVRTIEPDRRIHLSYDTRMATVARGGNRPYSRNSLLGPHIIRRFQERELDAQAFTQELQRGQRWRRVKAQILEDQRRSPGFVMENQLLDKGPNGQWVAQEQHYLSLRMLRENGRLRISDYFVGG